MTITELGALGEFVGSILTIVTLIYLATQVRQNTAQQKREELISVQHGQNSVVAQLQDPEVTRAYALASEGDGSASIKDRAMAIVFLIQYLNHFQIVHELYKGGSMEEEQYQLWAGFAVSIVASKGMRAWWENEDGRLGFHSGVRDLIDRRLNDESNPPPPFNKMWSIFNGEAWGASESDSSS
jgi:hypothetical protein